MDGVFVEFRVNQANVHPLNGLVSDGAFDTDFVEGLNDQFTSFVEVLDTLGVVDEDVCTVDGVNFSHGVFVHAVFTELGSNRFRIAVSDGTVAEFTRPQRTDNVDGQSLNFEKETVVPVGGLALKGASTV